MFRSRADELWVMGESASFFLVSMTLIPEERSMFTYYGSRSNDGNLPLSRSFPWDDDFSLHFRYLMNFIYFGALDASLGS